MSKSIKNYLRRLKDVLLKTKNFVAVSLLDQGFNSIISLIGSIYILAKLTIHVFAAAGFTISFSYFTSAIVKNKYITTLNYSNKIPQYTAFSLLKYLYKKIRLNIMLYSISLWILMIITTHNLITASILLLLGIGLFSADLIRNICIIKNIQKISVMAGIFSTFFLLLLIEFGSSGIEGELLLSIYSMFQFSYLFFMVLFMRKTDTSSNTESLQFFFKAQIRTSKLFQNESLIVMLLNIFSISVFYLLIPEFYSAMLIGHLFSATIPMFFSNALLPKIQTTYIRNRSQFVTISFLFWLITSILSLFFAVLACVYQEQISSLYLANTKQAFDIIFGVVSVVCAISLYQIFYLPLKEILKNGFLIYRSIMYLFLTVFPIFGALWKNSMYYVFVQILLLVLIGIMVLYPVFSKNRAKEGDHGSK